ncbi:hypothetical protein ACYPKM_04485 [Pseudomonas aeruginosa]
MSSFAEAIRSIVRVKPGDLLHGEMRAIDDDPRARKTPKPVVSKPFSLVIKEGLGPEDYPRIAEKVRNLQFVKCLFDGLSKCSCSGCAKKYLSWAEYECWRKYDPAFNRMMLTKR